MPAVLSRQWTFEDRTGTGETEDRTGSGWVGSQDWHGMGRFTGKMLIVLMLAHLGYSVARAMK